MLKFKVGDKVRIINYYEDCMNGKVGIIIEVRPHRVDFPYRMEFYDGWLPLRESELERDLKIGEQLYLFELEL